jgi:hypothetical protein
MIDVKNTDKENVDSKLDKLDSSVKYFAQNLLKLRTLPSDLKILENRINRLQPLETL